MQDDTRRKFLKLTGAGAEPRVAADLADILWNAAGRLDKAGGFMDDGLKAKESIHPGAARAMWTPAGRHNRGSFQPEE